VVASSTVHNLTGHLDTVQTRADDDAGESETHVVMIEVRHVSSNLCALWTLNVWGNEQVLNVTCNP